MFLNPLFFLLFNLSLKSTASASWQRKWVVNWKREKNVEWNMVLLEKITRWIMRFQHFFFQGRLSTLFFSDIDIRYPRIYMQMRKMDIIFPQSFSFPLFFCNWCRIGSTDTTRILIKCGTVFALSYSLFCKIFIEVLSILTIPPEIMIPIVKM